MQPPVQFETRLERLFNGRVRCRWSPNREEWHLEYKIARQKIVGFIINPNDDPAVRARDGYAFIMAVRPGDRMPCPRCNYTVKVPVFEIAEAVCDYCRLQGHDGRYPACYFPLDGDKLITELAKLDPQNTWTDTLVASADKRNDAMMAAKERQFENQIRSATLDSYKQLVGIPSFGYSGKTTMWQDAKGS